MKNLIIDATKEEVFFSIITDSQSYTTSYINSRENFDKFIDLLLIFFNKYKIELKDIEKIFVNQGPGKLSSIRTSISIAKAIALSKNISLIGFNSKDFDGEDYKKILKLENKNLLNKDLIKPHYSS
jgi:tRNA A37 threonylcarbamoyladenosine modification protein TsaB